MGTEGQVALAGDGAGPALDRQLGRALGIGGAGLAGGGPGAGETIDAVVGEALALRDLVLTDGGKGVGDRGDVAGLVAGVGVVLGVGGGVAGRKEVSVHRPTAGHYGLDPRLPRRNRYPVGHDREDGDR